MMSLPVRNVRRETVMLRKSRHQFTFVGKVGVEIRRIQLDCSVKPGRIVHAALAAPAVGVRFDRPLHQPGTVAVAMGENPLQKTLQPGIKPPDPLRIRLHFLDFRDAVSQNRRLRDLRTPRG